MERRRSSISSNSSGHSPGSGGNSPNPGSSNNSTIFSYNGKKGSKDDILFFIIHISNIFP